jgi:hypothetical protein
MIHNLFPDEVHAELISAEARLMLLLLEFMKTDQTTSGFLRQAADNIANCVSSAK